MNCFYEDCQEELEDGLAICIYCSNRRMTNLQQALHERDKRMEKAVRCIKGLMLALDDLDGDVLEAIAEVAAAKRFLKKEGVL